MKYKILIFCIVFTLLSCSKKKDILTQSKLDSSRASIMKYDSTDKDCKRIFPFGHSALLNDEDLNKIEDAIDKILEKQNPEQIKLYKELSKIYPEENYKLEDFILKKKDYIRRYLVITNEKNEKEIYLALVCDSMAKEYDFRKTLNQGYGGGSCLFSFKLNLDSNKFYEVYFNAEA